MPESGAEHKVTLGERKNQVGSLLSAIRAVALGAHVLGWPKPRSPGGMGLVILSTNLIQIIGAGGIVVEFLKIVLSFLGGGLAGVLLNEWLRRRNARVQPIPLIERVNRLVSPELKGFTLARVVGEDQERHLEEITKVRDYQLTLRNTSSVHLQNAEIQFEFPADDVIAQIERPVLSKTALIPIEASITEPWKRGFRWRIPQFPSTDSIEFTFNAIDPASDDYEVSLFNSGPVVIKKSKGEPNASRVGSGRLSISDIAVPLTSVVAAVVLFLVFRNFVGTDHQFDAVYSPGGCSLEVMSGYQHLENSGWPWQGPWQIVYRITNVGSEKCYLRSAQLPGVANTPVAIDTDDQIERHAIRSERPERQLHSISAGVNGPDHEASIYLWDSHQ